MAELILVVGEKNYSSWSLRPWLFMRQAQIPFTEICVPLSGPASAPALRRHSPSGKVPVLRDGDLTIWDSLAICQYLVEKYPQVSGWPKDLATRAIAYSVCAEMHSGFLNLRRELPLNCRAEGARVTLSPEAEKEVARVLQLWRDCREQFGGKQTWLFGEFGIADAFYAPVALRFKTYGLDLGTVEQAYVDAILALPAIRDWVAAAKQEVQANDKSTVGGSAK